MSRPKVKLRILLDAGVPDSVGRKFAEFGHEVIYHRDVLLDKTPDDAVCATALASNAVLVAIDADMKQFPKRYGVTPKGDRFKNLHIIRLCCNEVQAANRLEQGLPLVEQEWDFAQRKKARRMWIDIGAHSITTHR